MTCFAAGPFGAESALKMSSATFHAAPDCFFHAVTYFQISLAPVIVTS